METDPAGEMDPLAPAVAVIVKFLILKVAVTLVLAFMVTVQVEEVPVHPPDQPAKVELASGAAVNVTRVPALKEDPDGFVDTVPIPVPALVTDKV